MKLIISKDGVKRLLRTPFALCCDVGELEGLIDALTAARAGMIANGGHYGWMRIDTAHPDENGPMTPLEWSDRVG